MDLEYLSIISEIFALNRLKLILILTDCEKTLNEISKEIKLSKPEISRHLQRLVQAKVISKDSSNNTYYLTSLGQNFRYFLFPFESIAIHKEYFETHNVNLPINISWKIGTLINCELIGGLEISCL